MSLSQVGSLTFGLVLFEYQSDNLPIPALDEVPGLSSVVLPEGQLLFDESAVANQNPLYLLSLTLLSLSLDPQLLGPELILPLVEFELLASVLCVLIEHILLLLEVKIILRLLLTTLVDREGLVLLRVTL